jgi:hypothetical protein
MKTIIRYGEAVVKNYTPGGETNYLFDIIVVFAKRFPLYVNSSYSLGWGALEGLAAPSNLKYIDRTAHPRFHSHH